MKVEASYYKVILSIVVGLEAVSSCLEKDANNAATELGAKNTLVQTDLKAEIIGDDDGHGFKRAGDNIEGSELLADVHLLRRHAAWQLPLECMDKRRHDVRHHPLCHGHGGAEPAPGPKRDELELLPSEVQVVPVEEPLGNEVVGHVPRRRVAHDRPRVEDHRATPGHGVAADLDAVLLSLLRQQGRHRVQPHGLLHDGLEVRQPGHVGFLDGVLAAEGARDLRAQLGHHARVAEQLGHRPLRGDRHGVAAGDEEVEHDESDVLATDLACGHELEEHIEEAVAILVFVDPGQATVDDTIQDLKDFRHVFLHPVTPALQVERPKEGEKVGDVRPGHGVDELLYGLPQRGVHVDDVGGEEHAGDEVEGAAVQGLLDVHHLPGAGAEARQKVPHLALPDGARRRDAARREHVRRRDAAHRLPERVRAGQPEHGTQRAQAVRDGARREPPVVECEGLPGSVAGGDNHGRDEAQVQAHDGGAVLAGKPRQRVVEVAAAQVQDVADERERSRAGRPPVGARAPAAAAE
ncbi:hypothetical protein U9M48_012286 [Paspalum notatum var. saurae]|uniref:Uncharacterized protein n=1 Tax=Paspalum notatum var. saurae TaxID=547442 RepID=A0AAQ3WI79_PASNO